MIEFLQQLDNGITVGSIYALVALGYTMVYGILFFINFAHGEIYMMGAFLCWTLVLWKVPFILAFFVSMACCGLLGVIIEKIAYRPLRYVSRLGPLITAIGVSILLQNLAALIWGNKPKPFSLPDWFPFEGFDMGGVIIDSFQITILCISILLMIGLDRFVMKTKMGKAMRATAENIPVASLMGINVDTVISTVFAIGSILAAVGGILVGMYYNSLNPMMGFVPGLAAFTAAVLGGIGNIRGAMLGGMLIGILENIGAGYISAGYKQAIAFIVLVLLLLFRQEGLLGQVEKEKV